MFDMHKSRVQLGIVYPHEVWRVWDLYHALEFELQVQLESWRGVARGYAALGIVEQFAAALKGYPTPSNQEVVLAGGDETHGGFRLCFFVYDLAGHVGCRAELVQPCFERGLEHERFCLVAIMKTEPSLIDRFVLDLNCIARDLSGVAVLGVEC
ncbi:MAG: hypothetical protein V2A79_03320 [Planctomycetota bacterium]